jgi:cobalt-zinc-cadmium resistance protein CzcA
LAGLPHLEEMRSISKFGLSQITLRFSDETDVWFARQQVAERTSRVELPEGLQRPSLGPVATGLGEVFHYIMKGNGQSLEELRTLHDWVIARSSGGRRCRRGELLGRQREAVARRRRPWPTAEVRPLLGDVYEALERNNANVGGGTVERGGSTSLVLGVAPSKAVNPSGTW